MPGTATPGSLTINGSTGAPSTLQATSTFSLSANRGIALGSGTVGSGGAIDVTGSYVLTYGGVMANTASPPFGGNFFTKTDTGTLILSTGSGGETYTGPTTVAGGTAGVGRHQQ